MSTNLKSLSAVIKATTVFLALVLPLSLALAAEPRNFKELVGVFLNLINGLIPVIFTLTFAVLVFSVIKDWVLVGSPESIESGKRRLLIGLIALAVMSGVWGLVAILKVSLFG